MKKLAILLSILAFSLSIFAQYTENKLPSGLTVSTTTADADYTIIQKNGETYVKAIRMDTLKAYFSAGIISEIEPLDSVSGATGQIIISDGAGWLAPANGKYEGSWAWTFGLRGAGTIGGRSFLIGTGGGTATHTNSVSISGGKATNTLALAVSYGTASGVSSFAFGTGSTAIGTDAVAFSGGVASGASSTAWNEGTASKEGSTAWNNGTAIGDYSTAWNNGTASGENSTAWSGGKASGKNSTAWNNGTASGDNSTAWSGGKASGRLSTAWNGGNAQSYYETSFGQYPYLTSSNPATDSWVATDRLLTIGNGTNAGSPSNALVMLKNGNTTVSGEWNFEEAPIIGASLEVASSDNVGKIRYSSDANNSYCEMVMQTGASTYAWVVIKTNTW